MILNTTEFSQELQKRLLLCKSSFTALSAFIKVNTLSSPAFTENLKDRKVVVVARWNMQDLISGASDLEVYELCRTFGWKFGISLNLHGKVYVIDESSILLGSANLTQRGLSLGSEGNHEFGLAFNASNDDIDKLYDFVDSEVTWINDTLYERLKLEIEQMSSDSSIVRSDWSLELRKLILRPVKFIWRQELLLADPKALLDKDLNNIFVKEGLSILDLSFDDISDKSLKSSFKKTRLYKWLLSTIGDQTFSFGSLTAALHESILDNPKPYRAEIKDYIKTIFFWADYLTDTFEIWRPNHTQLIKIRSDNKPNI